MKMKKIISLCLIVVMAIALSACSKKSSTTQAGADNSDTAKYNLIKDGTLTIGAEIGYAPFEYLAEDGTTPIGYDVDFAEELGEKLGLKINFINTAWDGIFGGIGTNYDVVISAVTINEERLQTMLFSTPYINNYQDIVIKKGSDQKFTSLLDLDGKTVSLQKETTSDELLSNMISTGSLKASVIPNEKIYTSFTQLENGEIDAVLCDSSVADTYVAANSDKYEIAYVDKKEVQQFGVAIGKENTELQTAINDAIKELQDEKFFEDNQTKWFSAGE